MTATRKTTTKTTVTAINTSNDGSKNKKGYILAFGKSAHFADTLVMGTKASLAPDNTTICSPPGLVCTKAFKDSGYAETFQDYTHGALLQFPTYHDALEWYKLKKNNEKKSNYNTSDEEYLLAIAEGFPTPAESSTPPFSDQEQTPSTEQQQQQPGFAMGIIKIDKPEEYKPYLTKVAPVVAAYGGTLAVKQDVGNQDGLVLLANDGTTTTSQKDDSSFSYAVLVTFPTTKRAEAWAKSEEYREPRTIRNSTSHGPFLVL